MSATLPVDTDIAARPLAERAGDASEGAVTHGLTVALVSAGVLTLLFSLEELSRRGSAATPALWGRLVASNAIDWGLWALFVPVIVRFAGRVRIGDVEHRVRNAAVWIGFGVACALVHSALTGAAFYRAGLLPPGLGGGTPDLASVVRGWMATSLAFNLIVFLMIAGALHAAMFYADARARELRAADVEARLARSELTVLRMQLHPHFFFNALHTISSLVTTDARAAQHVIAALGDLVRASIDHTASHEIALRDEIAFVNRYVDVQRARFRRRLRVDIDTQPDTLDALVPSLVLQPLVENAIRHGVEPYTSGGHVRITARRDGNAVVLTVDNEPADRTEPAARAPRRDAGPGIGLANIQARLAQLYGTRHQFRAGEKPDGGFEVTLRLPLVGSTVPTDAATS